MNDLQNSPTRLSQHVNRPSRKQAGSNLRLSSATMTMSLKHEIRLPVLTKAYVARLQEEALQRIKNSFVSLRKLRRESPHKSAEQSITPRFSTISVSDVVTSLTQDLLDEFITRVCSEIAISMDRLLAEMGINDIPPHPTGAVPLTETLTASMLNNTATLSGPGLSLHQSPSRTMQKARSYHRIPARSK